MGTEQMPDNIALLATALMERRIVTPEIAQEIQGRLSRMDDSTIKAVLETACLNHGEGCFEKAEFWAELLQALRAETKH